MGIKPEAVIMGFDEITQLYGATDEAGLPFTVTLGLLISKGLEVVYQFNQA